MATILKFPRGTRADLTTLAGSSGLIPYSKYWVTDEGRFAVATAVNTLVDLPIKEPATIFLVLDGGGVAIEAGQTVDLPDLPYDCTVLGWTITGDASGDAVATISKATYSNFPTFTPISGTEKPTLSAQQKNQDLTLSTWTTSLTAGDTLRAVIDSAATVTRLTIALRVERA